MTVLFALEAAEAFGELPRSGKEKVVLRIGLLREYPLMLRGYRHLAVDRHLFYYSLNTPEEQA